MRVTRQHAAAVPAGNLRVTRAEFAAVWAAAEQLSEVVGSHTTDRYFAGVAATCRWLAGATERTSGGRIEPAGAPVTGHGEPACAELIDAEYRAAEEHDQDDSPSPGQPGWHDGVWATLRWAWRNEGPPPLSVPPLDSRAPV